MIDGWPFKVGIAGLLLGAVWGVSYGIERAWGDRLVNRPAVAGALVPEVAEEIEPIRGPMKHSALVTLSVPQIRSIDPGSVSVSTPGYTLDDAQIRPILEYKKVAHPKPRSIVVLLDNSRSMVTDYDMGGRHFDASDADYRRLDACRQLFEALSNTTDKISLACFPCRHSNANQQFDEVLKKPFELLAKWVPPAKATDVLETLRGAENGSTPLFRGTEQAAELLATAPKGTQKVLVVLTDGKDTDRQLGLRAEVSEQRAVDAIHASGAETYAIGLGPDADVDVLKQMCSTVLKADDASALNRTFQAILHQMSREVVQIDLDVTVGHVGKPIPTGSPIEITYRSGGKLYKSRGTTQP